jgi:enamine deaminase RidA (YjgF/YER057c/UK114 family)
MDPIEEKLHKLGLSLPSPPVPGGSYVPFRLHGSTLILAGVISGRDGAITSGQVGRDLTVEAARTAAQLCALNLLAAAKLALGRLDRVKTILFLSGYVNAVSGFDQSPQVINGASDLLVELYGEAGRHARAAIAVAGLPRNAAVEIQATFAVE